MTNQDGLYIVNIKNEILSGLHGDNALLKNLIAQKIDTLFWAKLINKLGNLIEKVDVDNIVNQHPTSLNKLISSLSKKIRDRNQIELAFYAASYDTLEALKKHFAKVLDSRALEKLDFYLQIFKKND